MSAPHRGNLRIGLVGSGFIADFHLRSLVGVRNVEVRGVCSRNPANRERIVRRVEELDLGVCRSHDTMESLFRADDIDAVWILAPNYTRVDIMRCLSEEVTAGRSRIFAVACEKPLGRTLAEAREMLRLAEEAGLNHGYLENQVFATPVLRGKEIVWRRGASVAGRPYLARAAEEHTGPHEPWFWQGEMQGGGVLLDMMCHSIEVARHLLTAPGAPRSSLTVRAVTGHLANLKWTRPAYAQDLSKRFGDAVDYRRRPSEDYARGTVLLEDGDGNQLVIEASTSWGYVGAGLRIQLELLGPEYSMEFNSLSAPLKVFMSRAVSGADGEDLVEKQNAEQGLMPVLEDEAGVYGYTDENRHMVESFRRGHKPLETFEDGVAVVQILMGLYRSAERGETQRFPAPELEDYVPEVARRPPA